MTYSAEFNKPAPQVIVDLVNRTLLRQFAYNKVNVAMIPSEMVGKQCVLLPELWPNLRCRERTSVVLTVDGYVNTLAFQYHRLYFQHYIPYPVFLGDGILTEAEILTQLRERYNVLLDPDTTVTIMHGNKVDGDTAWRGKITPSDDHLVWASPLEFLVAPAHHIAHELTTRHLAKIDFTEDADIAQEILTVDLEL